MLLATLGASFISIGKRILRAGYRNKDGKGMVELVMDLKIKKSRSIIRMNLDLMEFTPEIICLKMDGSL